MQNNNYQTRHPRRSSPPIKELEQGWDKWVLGLRPIKQTPQDSLVGSQKKVLTAQEYGPVMESGDEGRWHDDGGEGV